MTQKVSLIIRKDGTIAISADVFIIDEKLNYLFIFSTSVILFSKND